MRSSAEKKAPPDSTRNPSSASRRKTLQAQSTSVTLSPKKIRLASRYARAYTRPDERIGALDPEAGDDVGRVGLGETRRQPADVRHLELAVTIGEGNEVVAGRPEPGPQRSPVPEVGGMVDHAHDVGVRDGQGVSDGRGSVARAVIDGDDLERVSQGRQSLQRLGHEPADVGFLVVRREEVRKAGDPVRRRIAGAAAEGTAVVANMVAIVRAGPWAPGLRPPRASRPLLLGDLRPRPPRAFRGRPGIGPAPCPGTSDAAIIWSRLISTNS